MRRFAGGEFVGDLSLAITAAVDAEVGGSLNRSIHSPSLVGDAGVITKTVLGR